VVPILRKLAEKGYSGALSVELFRAELVNGDPFAVASQIRSKCEAVMAEAGVD
jgi:sugar phosphate isomerase/epimerase